MFQQIAPYSPAKQDFIWLAEYADGSYISEFDFSTHQENNFYSIKKNSVIRFGLIGAGYKLYYECFGGSFKLLGRMYDFIYQVNGKNLHLTGQNIFYNDIITYKDAEALFDFRTIHQLNRITQYNFGYKVKLSFDDTKLKFQAICQIPYNQSMRFNIKLTSNMDLDGKLLILCNGQLVNEFDAPLKKDAGGELNWLLK